MKLNFLDSNLGKNPRDLHFQTALLILTVFAITLFGLVMVYSTSYIYAQERFHEGLYFFKRQLTFAALGAGFFFLGRRISLRFLEKNTYAFLGGAVLLLGFTFIPGLGHKAGGASRWLQIRIPHVFNIQLQPSELIKVAVLLFIAVQTKRKLFSREVEENFRTNFLSYFTGVLPIYVLLMLQPDFGTTALLLISTTLILLGLGISWRYLFTLAGVLLPTATLLIATSAYRRARFESFLNPWLDATGKGFQVIQSLLAVYNGGLTGVGFGNSKGKLFYLPEAHNDFIFAVIAEEAGLIAIIALIALYFIIVQSGLKAARTLYDPFDRTLALGIAVLFGLQASFHMGVVLGLLPAKGLPLPLISYGGSSIIVWLFLCGLLTQLREKSLCES